MTIVLIAILGYLTATALLVRAAAQSALDVRRGWLWPALIAVILHGGYHLLVAWRTAGGPDMHFYSALSLVSLGMAALTALAGATASSRVDASEGALPPLTELEDLLFRTIAVGFALLTATLLTGVLFVENLLAQHLVHKTVLSVLSWLAFGALLIGRWRYGWRGSKAAGWTLFAMALLLLAFFGSKFVLELVLRRA